MHTTADDPKRYRTEEEVAQWRRRDPLPRFQKYLQAKKLLTPKRIAELEAEIKAEIQSAVDAMETQAQTFNDPLHMFAHAYAELPPGLREQREKLARELSETSEEAHDG